MPTRLLLVVALVGSLVSTAQAAPTLGSGHPIAPDQVIVSLYQTLAWYREARQAMRDVGSVFGREDEETAVAVLRAAFETARAQTALLAEGTPAESPRPAETGPLAGKRSEIQAAIEADIGLVRIRLRELAGDPLCPTGRIVVFPNSVVFTGSFFKHPTGTEEAQGNPTPHRGGLIARQIH
jgi:hypothetical protein